MPLSSNDDIDVIDSATSLAPGDALRAARRFRAKVVDATQASHDALLNERVPGLSTADRLRVAGHVCTLAGAPSLALHYATCLAATTGKAQRGIATDGDASPSPALPAMLAFAAKLTTDPRLGDRAALDALRNAGLGDATIVALAQLVAFLSYQLRVVAGLRALHAFKQNEPDDAEGAR